jgi:hypothetical protein
LHIVRAGKNAALGRPYVVQLARNTARPMSDEYRAGFTEYWQALGAQIGQAIAPIPVPSAAAATKSRAVKIRPEMVRKLTALDMNVVYQRLDLPPGQAFDLVIGTNIFVYYGEFEQLLARSNVATMLKPGGYLLSNDKLADKVPFGLNEVLETPITSSVQPLVQDAIFCYQRSKQ